jgi:hypothetical protein
MESKKHEEEEKKEQNSKKRFENAILSQFSRKVLKTHMHTRTASRVLIHSSDCFCQGEEPSKLPKSTGAAQ